MRDSQSDTNREVLHKTSKGFVEGVDFYFENGFMILTAHFLEKRGYCCGNGCRHCPFDEKTRLADHNK